METSRERTTGVSIELLPLTTIMGDDTVVSVVQEVCESIDTSRYRTGVITARSVQSLGVDLVVEGSDDGQAFIALLEIPAATVRTATAKHLNRSEAFGSSGRLYRILRWRLAGLISPVDWEFCGRVNVVLK